MGTDKTKTMKGTRLFILVLLAAVLSFIIILFIISGGKLGSWSEADLFKAFRWLLVLLLGSIARMWWKFSDKHTLGNNVLLQNWHGLNITYKKAQPYYVLWLRFFTTLVFKIMACLSISKP